MDIPEHLIKDKQSMDQYSRFLEPTAPKGQTEWFEQRKMLVGKECSVANIEREDMIGYLDLEEAILEFLEEGQIATAKFMLIKFQAELKLTMSFEGRFMDQITTNKFDYTQKQDVTEHVMPMKKKGFLGLGGK